MKHTYEQIPARQLSGWEKAVISRLLSVDFAGRDVLVQQLASTEVTAECQEGCPSVELQVKSTVRADVDKRVPVEGNAVDSDGTPILLLIHVSDGRLTDLEVVRADSEPIQASPRPDEIVLGADSSPDSS